MQSDAEVERTARRISGMRGLNINIKPARPANRRQHFYTPQRHPAGTITP